MTDLGTLESQMNYLLDSIVPLRKFVRVNNPEYLSLDLEDRMLLCDYQRKLDELADIVAAMIVRARNA